MKILMTTDTIGGVWHYTLDLARGLLAENVDVVLLAMGQEPDKAQEAQVSNLQGLKFHYFSCKLEWMDNPWSDVKLTGDWIREIYNDERPDVLHFNHYAHVTMEWNCPVVLVAHSCVVSWWRAVKKEPLPERFDQYFKTVKNALHTADVVVFPTASMAEVCQEIYGTLQNTQVIYNGVSIPGQESKKKPIIFSMGRLWDEAKNIDLILQAAKLIKGNIYIAGRKENKTVCPKNVTFLGQLSRQEVFDWLNLSALYVLPVKYEPFGLSFLEAASHRCALIGGNIPTLKELWKDSMTYTSTSNHRELAKACNKLLSDPEHCETMRRKAFENSKKFSIEKKKNQYMKIYSNMQEPAFNHNYNKNIYL